MIGGGGKAWTVFLTRVDDFVGHVPDSDLSASSKSNTDADESGNSPSPTAAADPTPVPDSTQNAPASVVTRASTVVVTAPGQTRAQNTVLSQSSSSKGPNKSGIAVGVVVGILAIFVIAGGLFFFLRNRKRRALEGDYHRNTTDARARGAHPTSGSSMSDSRLEPSVMMQRRQSDGSIADNQDYSRRILKVILAI